MNKVLEYRKLLGQLFYYQNRGMEAEEDKIMDDLDLVWRDATSSELEGMHNCIIFNDGKDYKAFNDAWKLYHTEGKHRPFFTSYKTWDDKEVKIRNTNLKPIHYLIHGIVNGVAPHRIFSKTKCEQKRGFEETINILTGKSYADYLHNIIKEPFGDIIKDEHIEMMRKFLNAAI